MGSVHVWEGSAARVARSERGRGLPNREGATSGGNTWTDWPAHPAACAQHCLPPPLRRCICLSVPCLQAYLAAGSGLPPRWPAQCPEAQPPQPPTVPCLLAQRQMDLQMPAWHPSLRCCLGTKSGCSTTHCRSAAVALGRRSGRHHWPTSCSRPWALASLLQQGHHLRRPLASRGGCWALHGTVQDSHPWLHAVGFAACRPFKASVAPGRFRIWTESEQTEVESKPSGKHQQFRETAVSLRANACR